VGGYYTDGTFTFAGGPTGHFRVAKVGLYLDQFGTGVPPVWVEPQYAEELIKCMRYWYRCYSPRGVWNGATNLGRASIAHPVTMRVNPGVTVRGAPPMYDGLVGANAAGISNNFSNTLMAEFEVGSTAGGFTVGRPGITYVNTVDDYYAINARM
jgi:hypothetical protein